MSKIQDIKDRSVYWLAKDADCLEPDSDTSPGAQFLADVRDAMVEAIESNELDEDDDASDLIREIADQAPDVYTHPRWKEFTDLGAWQEEPESGDWPEDLTDTAGVALYQIAERLCHSLLAEWREDQEPEDGDDDDGPDDGGAAIMAVAA